MRSRVRRSMVQMVLLALVAAVGVVVPTAQPAGAATVPSGFTDEVVASVVKPTALAFLPDGRLLIATQPGQLRVMQDDALVATPALSLTVCSNSERGLLGVAVDPEFATPGHNFIYLYYTANTSGCVNRVSRFSMTGNTVDPASEVKLVDNIPSTAGNHNGGDVHFGNDGLLYISIGDGGCDYKDTSKCAAQNTASRDQNILLGKILRITKDGTIPDGNPWKDTGDKCRVDGRTTPGHTCKETFAWGLRNPFRFAFDPNVGGAKFHINDVGQDTWEEIDLGTAGADYGWNVREGHCATGSTTNCNAPPVGMTNPIFDYGRVGDGCASITGGAFVPTAAGWPAPYSGAYLFADYVCGKIFRLVDNGNGTFSRADFVTDLGVSSATSLTFGPSPSGQSLYYTSYFNGGAVHRINVTTGNRPPTAAIGASATSGPLPLHVSFTSTGSNDPDNGDTLSYRWTFGDGSPVDTTSGATATHDYTVAGTYTASLTVMDNHGSPSQPANITIRAGNNAPTPTITAPSPDATFKVGQQITLKGTATDPEDGTLAASRLEWTVIKHHDTHTHPFLGPVTGATATFSAPPPEDLLAATNSYLEIQLKATDSAGLSTTVMQNLEPRKVNLTFASVPSGRTLEIAGSPMTAPQTVVSWVGYAIEVFAPSPQGAYGFRKWSDRGAQRHTWTTPKSDSTLTATFKTG